MRGLKVLVCAITVVASLAFAPMGNAQIGISIGVPPACPYGYYDYAPYACAPVGFYGPGYFYNGIFLGVGPWYRWGYAHGWGGHRFIGPGGGRYVGRYGGRGDAGARGGPAYRGRPGGPVGHTDRGGFGGGACPGGAARPGGGVHPSGGGARPGGAARPSGGGARPGGGGHAEPHR